VNKRALIGSLMIPLALYIYWVLFTLLERFFPWLR